MACIKENLKFTKLENKAVTWNRDVMTALYQMEEKKVFDYIFMDPPYDCGLERQMLEYLKDSGLIDKQSTMISEASLHTSFDYLEELGFVLEKNKEYKTNRHVFVYRGE